MIKKWFDENGGALDTSENRISRLVRLFNHLKQSGVSEVTEDMASEILLLVSKGLDHNIVLLEIFNVKEMIFSSEVETTKPEPVVAPKPVIETKLDDDYDEEDAKPKLHIDKSELKTKEFDLEVLADLGLNIEDLQNE